MREKVRERVDDGVFILRGRPIRGGIDGEVREEEIEVHFYIYRNGLGEHRVGWEEPTHNLLVEGHRVHLGSLEGDILRYWLRSGRPQAVAEARRQESWERRRLRTDREVKLLYHRYLESKPAASYGELPRGLWNFLKVLIRRIMRVIVR